MPGLLNTSGIENYSTKFWVAVSAEFLGVVLFAFFGGACPASSGPVGNGIALAVLVYVTANISGGHLNPAVTIATVITGHTSISKALLYIVAQLLGAVAASALHVVLIPDAHDVGCFSAPALSQVQLLSWEMMMTFLLVVAIYAVAVGEPHFGVVAPLAVGLALFSAAVPGGGYTGAALNPARVLGPAIVFGCTRQEWWLYVVGEVLGGVLAALASCPLYGTGEELGRWLCRAREQLAEAAGYERVNNA